MTAVHRLKEAARLTGVSEATLRRLAMRGDLPVNRDAAGVLVVGLPDDPGQIRELLRRQRVAEQPASSRSSVVQLPIDMSQAEQTNALIDALRTELHMVHDELERTHAQLTRMIGIVDKLTDATAG